MAWSVVAEQKDFAGGMDLSHLLHKPFDEKLILFGVEPGVGLVIVINGQLTLMQSHTIWQ